MKIHNLYSINNPESVRISFAITKISDYQKFYTKLKFSCLNDNETEIIVFVNENKELR